MEIRSSPEGCNCISSQNTRYDKESANNHKYILSETSWFNIMNCLPAIVLTSTLHHYSLVIVFAALSERLFFAKTKEVNMTVRAKFHCTSIQKSPDHSSAVVTLGAVTTGSVENESWSKYTPSGQLQMVVSNPAAFGQFEQGKEYFIDIQPAD
ncbi:hypothetical protein NGJ69_17240 [Atlantibacter hermannii]|uniref:hypothetical protein n=2 Tax=Atlantibacter hermannii TaxID=565 RepID=UPI002DB7F453|nr:hypothetical protein [Atlantibacter hermannii]MEB7925463.1 hypothetical protein [Atlantibacter hermannii]